MPQASIAFVTPADASPWKRRLFYSAAARIVIFATFVIVPSFAVLAAWQALGFGSDSPALLRALLQFVLRALLPLLAYVMLVKWIEARRIIELAPGRLLPEGLLGAAFGLALFSTIVGVLYVLGSYHVTGIQPTAPWLRALLVAGLGAGIGEEIMFRGVLFRIVEEGLGTWIALVLSALFFGAVHLGNPGATLWSSAAIAVEAGLLFGLLYHLTRSLPLCMGLHAAWNFAQGTIYGIPVSGIDARGWLVSTRSGPDWLSGGTFGAEASVVALGICSVLSLGLLMLAIRRGSIVPLRRPRSSIL